MKRIVYFSLALIMLGLSGCNTIEGAGEDIEAAGEEVEEQARESKRY